MCGLAGMMALHGGKVEPDVIERMADALRHRGPDDAGSFVQGPVGLGFRRLSILDLSPSGHQPMASYDGRYIIVFNGEIYNYVELRQELIGLGYAFRSSGDSEVLLCAYAAWGKDCLPKLNGMWAFMIYDTSRGVLFGSRDRFGVKPLYRYHAGDRMVFASEIKAILSSGYYAAETNWQVASAFLIQQHLDTTDETFFRGIVKVPAGSAFELDLRGEYKEWRYWSLAQLPAIEVGDPPQMFEELFEDAVRLRMRSDVPVGVSLSGGLDSTSIICAMARLRQNGASRSEAIWAFAYMAQEFDESIYINDTLAQTQAQLVRLEIDATSLLDKLNEVLWYHDEPIHTMTALIGYELMRLAADNGVKVVLGGQGADETLAGYRNYFPHYWHTLYTSTGLRHTREEITAYSRGGTPDRLLREVRLCALRSKLRRLSAYRALARWRRNKIAQESVWFTRDFLASLPLEHQEAEQSLDAALRFSIERKNLPLYLRVEDRNSMAHSVEMRLPFMDFRLISYLFQAPPNWKMRGPWNKYILREAMRGKIPESVRLRPDKMGFPFPAQKWLGEGIRTSLLELLDSQTMRERGIYDLQAIRRALAHKEEDNRDLPYEAFNVIQFEVWCQLAKRSVENAHAASVSS